MEFWIIHNAKELLHCVVIAIHALLSLFLELCARPCQAFVLVCVDDFTFG